MIAAYVSTFLTALWSAFVPVTPIEPYLVTLAAVTDHSAIGLGLTAAVGQTIGKTLIFLGARGVFHSERVKRWVHRLSEHRSRRTPGRPPGPVVRQIRALGRPLRRAAAKLTELLERPALTLPILFLSAFAGLPPLLATSIYIAGTKVRTPVFVIACLIGRSARFIAIAYAPQLIL
ncbi:hypothetical protein [Glycomyces terrestris]|uniref:Uncharacterized protein n=1 Tax=Glycomyces terrestris TaxID=2493553 RepID=A0A426V147_9ACTN|nr:hypothetical protein [Glycomyces terrestris]RRS00608.1 hypothetical protein EIW28_08635 [Glycomyces terrestris]